MSNGIVTASGAEMPIRVESGANDRWPAGLNRVFSFRRVRASRGLIGPGTLQRREG